MPFRNLFMDDPRGCQMYYLSSYYQNKVCLCSSGLLLPLFMRLSYLLCVEVNRRDYRAWYGLGQTYEILKMPYYCLHYYKQAQMLR